MSEPIGTVTWSLVPATPRSSIWARPSTTYNVTFTQSEETEHLHVRDGAVTFLLDDGVDAHEYLLTGSGTGLEDSSFIVGWADNETAALTLNNGTVTGISGVVGFQSGSDGSLTLSNGTSLNLSGILHVGNSGQGTLVVNSASSLNVDELRMGEQSSGVAAVTFSGPGTVANMDTIRADAGQINLLIENGASVTSNEDTLWRLGLPNGTVSITVTGENSEWKPLRTYFGNSGSAVVTLNIEDGGLVEVSNESQLSRSGSAQGHVIVSGAGSTFATNSWLRLSDGGGAASITIKDGGTVTNAATAQGLIPYDNGVIQGDGTIDAWVQLRGGMLRPGLPEDPDQGTPAETGLLTLAKGLQISSFGDGGGILAFHIRDMADHDQLHVIGDFTLGAGLGDLQILDFADTSVGIGDSFQLFTWTGGDFTGEFGSISAFELDSGLFWDFSELYTDGIVAIIPEPSTVGLVLMTALGWCFARRRRSPSASPAKGF